MSKFGMHNIWELLRIKMLMATLAFLPVLATAQQNVYRQGIPMHIPMSPESVEWQRDVYREVKMVDEKNLGLFFCPDGTTLFSRIFDCVLSGAVPAFPYYENSIEECKPDEELDVIRLLKDYGIHYSVNKGKITVDAVDIPNERISSYYIKESVCYDHTNSSFRTQVTAICPVMDGEDEFEEGHEVGRYGIGHEVGRYGMGRVRYPLFWIRYDDIEKYLTDIKVYPNTRNLRARMPVIDYLARNLYNGHIYKVFNPQGLTLPQQIGNETALTERQTQIEQEIKEIRKHTYDTFVP